MACYGLHKQRFMVQFPEGMRFFLLQSPEELWDPSSLLFGWYSNGTFGKAMDYEANHSPSSSSQFKNE
jgi:hypothetical protein